MELTKEEEEDGFEVDGVECGDEIFASSLVGKLWSTDPYNARIFKQVIVQAWRLKNPVEVQDLNKNLYLFRLSSKRDAETVMKNGPWSFDRNLLILKRISGDEQPSDLEMNTSDLWARVYDLPLKLRSNEIAKKLGDMLGKFVEVDSKESNRMGKFLRVKATIDLRKPLKRGTVIKYKGNNLCVYFKYERLPTFCFVCGKIGHQIKDCDDMEGKDDTNFDELEEKELPFGQWLRASPLPKVTGEVKKETSTGSCSKTLFSETSNSKEATKEKGKEAEVEQIVSPLVSKLPLEVGTDARGGEEQEEVESVAESLNNVAISVPILGKLDKGSHTKPKPIQKDTKKWSRKKGVKKVKATATLATELGKRQLIEVNIVEGDPWNCVEGNKEDG